MSVIETNIRLLTPGPRLYIDTRVLQLNPKVDTPELLQRIASRVATKLRTSCIPCGERLLIASNRSIAGITIEFENFATEICDIGPRRLLFSHEQDRTLMATLIERRLYMAVPKRTNWWRFGQFHTWYDPKPIAVVDDVAAYRRYSASAVVLDSVGIGVATDVTTTFFTTRSVSDYLQNSDQFQLRKRFERLTSRQSGHKGTLLYDLGDSKHKCYFDQYCPEITCATTPSMRIKGVSYTSLYDYLNRTKREGLVSEEDPVARVSFPGLDRPQLVPAARLFVRVANEELPPCLKEIDKLEPEARRNAIADFWRAVGLESFGPGISPASQYNWRPSPSSTMVVRPPALEFKHGKIDAPIERSRNEYKRWFRDRLSFLGRAKAFYVPPTAPRTIQFIAPIGCPQDAVKALGDAICDQLFEWTGIRFNAVICTPYSSIDQGISIIERNSNSGVAVFVFEDDDPAAYFEIEYGLKGWRVKRVRVATLRRHHSPAKTHLSATGVRKNGNNGNGGHRGVPKELWRWNSFVRLCALDVFQKLGALPWRVEPTSAFEAELSIDVGADRRQFAVSLLVNRNLGTLPELCLETLTEWKSDVKHESINPEQLKSAVIKIFRSVPISSPLKSVAVFRDGGECGQEHKALEEAFQILTFEDRLTANAELTYSDVRKSGVRNIRVWEVDGNHAVNALEGVALRLRRGAALLCTTGSAGLTQGSADPILLMCGNGSECRLDEVVEQFFHSAQLNYSSPTVAQRLSAGLKRTDEELKARAAQEIRRIK